MTENLDPNLPEKSHSAATAHSLQARLRSAFQTNEDAAKGNQSYLHDLRSGLEAGKFGGVPLKGDVPSALVALLEELNWPRSLERFARCMPHFPTSYSLSEMRGTLALLGFQSQARKLRLAEADSLFLPAVVQIGNSVSLLRANAVGDIVPVDPSTGVERPFERKKRYKIVSFTARTVDEQSATGREPWLAKTLRRFFPQVLGLLGLTAVINTMVLIVAYSVMSIYDSVIPAGAYDTLAAIVLGVALASGFELVFRSLKARQIGRITGRLEFLLSSAIFSKLVSLPVHMVTNTPVGDQIGRLRQFESVRDIFAGPFVAVGLEVPFIVVFIAGLFLVGGPLGYVPLVLIIAYICIGAFMIGPLRRQNELAAQTRRAHYQTALETATNLRIIRSLGCQDVWLERLAKKTAESAKAKRRANLSQRFLITLSGAGVPVAGTATVVIGSVMVMNGQISVGVLIGAMIIVWRVLAPIQQLFLMLSRYTDMAQMMTQIDGVMRLPVARQFNDGQVKRSFAGQIRFDRVSFRYNGSSQGTLQGLTFTIEPGAFIAVKGHSGSGKSSLLRLILDLYQPQVGNVQIDGVNVKQIPTENLRAAIGYVPQTPAFFHGTIAQNLRLVSPSASDDRLRQICGEVGLLEAIDQLPKGMDTLLDHARQESLPGGFRQALAIAQALLRESSILLLDEPAKTLDYDLEAAFLACLERRRGKITIVMVSHRPSHIRLADRVLALDQGQITSFDPPPKNDEVAA